MWDLKEKMMNVVLYVVPSFVNLSAVVASQLFGLLIYIVASQDYHHPKLEDDLCGMILPVSVFQEYWENIPIPQFT